MAPDLLWAQFDDSDDWVVYHPGSCDTHLVSTAARRLWLLVADGARFADMAAMLSADAGRPLNHEMIEATSATLAFMDRAGLIRPVTT